ncbi:MAG: hypothetical protein QOD60_1628 [Solirubrobacterales bacterium]|nr:hypothetical protein [Solirubrobacterales bacterium]
MAASVTSCSSCGTPLAADQRYCIACGQRVGTPIGMVLVQNPQAPPAQASPLKSQAGPKWLPVPPHMASAFGAMAIGFGVVIGSAISPGVQSLVAASPPLVAAAPATPPVATPTIPAPIGGGGSATPAASTSFAPSTSPTSGSGGGGGGNHKKKKKKKKPAATAIAGTVVHVNPVAGSFAVAAGGNLISVHSATLPAAGDQVSTQVTKLYNGTYSRDADRTTTGTTKAATFTGAVSYRDETALTYVVSSRGSSVLVHAPQSTAAQIPQIGAGVTVSVAIGDSAALTAPAPVTPAPLIPPPPPPCDTDGPATPSTPALPTAAPLTQTSLNIDLPSVNTLDLEGIVQAVCPATSELVLSADDTRESFSDMLLPVPVSSAIDLSKVTVGQSFNLSAAFDPSAKTLTVTGSSSDQGSDGANNAALAQGTEK